MPRICPYGSHIYVFAGQSLPIWDLYRSYMGKKGLYGAHAEPEWDKCPDSAHMGPIYTCLLGCFSVLLVLRLPRLGKRELILVLFVRLFGLCLFRFVGFLFLLGSGNGCGLWLWHSLDFSLTFSVLRNIHIQNTRSADCCSEELG